MKQIAIAAMLIAATNGLCQSPPRDNDTLLSLMAEVHQLRIDIEAMTVASQRVQISLYKLQSQDAVVARAAQRADGLHDRCTRAEDARQHTAASVQRIDNALESSTMPESQTKNLQSQLAELKGMLDTQTAESQSCQASEAEAAGQLQREQGKQAELQDRLDRLDNALQKVGGSPR